VFADDANADLPAPGYSVLNARLVARQALAGWRISEFVRLNNLADRRYIGSVIVGDSNKRYYEAAPGRNWAAGVSAQYQF
jgi:iron complex outermembrane receptor protein